MPAMKNSLARQWSVYKTLIKREAWEYRDWWTIILPTCVVMGCFLLVFTQLNYGHPDTETRVQQSFLLIRWCQGFFLAGCGIMAMAQAAHGIFDERQDRSIGFWQAWPVSEKTRILAKSIAVAWGWPLLGCAGTLCIWVFAGMAHLFQGQGMEFARQTPDFLRSIAFSYAWMGAWAWPIACIWLWCSAIAPRSPWLWCWVMGGCLAGAGFLLQGPAIQMGLNMALGPAYGTLIQALGLDSSWIPWQIGSLAWWISCALGWAAVSHAARRLITQPDVG